MKLIRSLVLIVLLLIIIGALGIGALLLLMNPNQLRPALITEVKKQTGLDMVIDGAFSWSFYPRMGIQAEHISFTGPHQSVPFLELQDVTLVTNVTDLLQGNQLLRGDVYIGNVRWLNLHVQNAHVGLHWRDELLTLDPISADLYGGKLDASAHGKDWFAPAPRWDWNIYAQDLDWQALLKDLNANDIAVSFTGTGDIRFIGETKGHLRNELLSNLNGNGRFTVTHGVFEHINFNGFVQSAEAILNHQETATSITLVQPTEFNQLSGTISIKNGVLTTNNLMLLAPRLTARGQGSINLPAEEISLQWQIVPQAKMQESIPLLVMGNLYHPDIHLDTTALNIDVVREKVNDAKAKLMQLLNKVHHQKTVKHVAHPGK